MHTPRRRPLSLTLLVLACLPLAMPAAQPTSFMPLDDVQPGMTGIGRTVFEGETREEFRAHIIGVLRNVIGPRRDLVLARLEGGPIATAGVMQGMSGSPVYVDGRLLGAVSYALGAFPREPIAGITPIGEMIEAVDAAPARTSPQGPRTGITWPATPDDVYAALARVAARAAAPLGSLPADLQLVGPPSMATVASRLRPIGAAMVLSGFDPVVGEAVGRALAPDHGAWPQDAARAAPADAAPTLEPGDPVAMSLIRGDMESGATGTVTWVNGSRVYAFGHPFLNLGPITMAMHAVRVYTVLPSLDTSMKISTMGPVIGTMSQDRPTGVGGTLGAGPDELELRLTLAPERGSEREFTFHVVQDPDLTALFAYVAVFNTLVAYERQTGALSIRATGSLSFGDDGRVEIENFFSGPGAGAIAASSLTSALGAAIANDYRRVTAERLDLRLELSERQWTSTIERAWLDTSRPTAGAVHTLHVLLRDYQGGTRTVSLPITMPSRPQGPLTLLVSDATTLAARETRDLRPGSPHDWPSLLARLNSRPRNDRLYVRLIASSTGTVVAGETLAALPPSVRSILDADATVAKAPVSQTVIGAWDHPLDRAIQGSRELQITVTARD